MGKKAPAAPDYTSAAEATAQTNQWATQYQTSANRPDMVTPWGTSTWDEQKSFDQGSYDKAMADWNSKDAKWRSKNQALMPSQNDFYTSDWTNNVTLTPEQQASLDAQQHVQMNQSQLADQMQGQVADTMSKGLDSPELTDYVGNGPQLNTNFGGFQSGAPAVKTDYANFSNPNTDFERLSGFTGNGVGAVNTTAPQLTSGQDATKAAYDANTALLKPQMEQDTKRLDEKLRLQGLTPGTEAYNNAMQNLTKSQGAQLNQLANQSVLTGNEVANRNFSSELAGAQFGNSAQDQQFAQELNKYGTTQDAVKGNNEFSQQDWTNMLAAYMADQGAQDKSNTAQAQAYGQDLGEYQTDQEAQQNSNAAAQQDFLNNLQRYSTVDAAAYQKYYAPLNALSAVMNGQQVQMPSFNGAPNSTAGNGGGTDYLGAYTALGQYNSAAAAAKNSAIGGIFGGLTNMGAAYLGK
jgi:hypothetical protein